MKTVAFLSQKGGTGKSTLALALAVEAQRKGRSVVVVDLDPQTTSANWGDRRGNDRPAVVSCQSSRLGQVLLAAEKGGADLAFIDTPGKSDASSIAAARSADLVLLPIQPQLWDIETLPNVKDMLMLGGDPPALVVISRAPVQGRRHIDTQEAVAQMYRLTVCPVVIFARAAHGDAGNIGQVAAELYPEGKGAREIAELYSYIAIALKGGRHGKKKHAG